MQFSSFMRLLSLSLLGVAFYGASVNAAVDVFPHPPMLDSAVQFWQKVFTVWRRDQVVLHDDKHLGVVYDVIDVPSSPSEALTAEQRAYLQYRREHLQTSLGELERRLRLALPLGDEHQRLLDLFARSGDKYGVIGAKNRLRLQRGMRERFIQGVARSGRYHRHIRQVFRDFGLPEDLGYLPHVESSFVNNARSAAGAAGVWQFMRATGQHYLTINQAVDERFDPVFAARGAARYLKDAYRELGDWGLAITSYNHGVAGMARARREMGPAIDRIVRDYQGPRFGFASRNFYAEFLAVRSVMGNLIRHIPEGVSMQAPQDSEYVRLTRSVSFQQLVSAYGVPRYTLEDLNPAISARAVTGQVLLPLGTDVWVPRERILAAGDLSPVAERQSRFDARRPIVVASRYSGAQQRPTIPAKPKRASRLTHIVKKGDTPHRIASKYGVRVREVLALNALGSKPIIRPGQRLQIPLRR